MRFQPRLILCGVLLSFSASSFANDTPPATGLAVETPLPEAAVNADAPADAPLDRSKLRYSNKWRIVFDNRAKTNGTLVFRMTLQGSDADPVIVRIPIKKGTGENNAADAVKLALRKAFPKKFKVEGDDGESVLVKLNFVEGRSSLELLSNDVKNLKIKIRKE